MLRTTTALAVLAAAGLTGVYAAAPSWAATSRPTAPRMCLDAGNSRNNGDSIHLWQCSGVGETNRNLVIEDGQIIVKDTI